VKALLIVIFLVPVSLFAVRYVIEPVEKLAKRDIVLVATLVNLESKESHIATPNKLGDPKFSHRLDGRYLKERKIEGTGTLLVTEILKGDISLKEGKHIEFSWADQAVIDGTVLRFDQIVGYPTIWYLDLADDGTIIGEFGSAIHHNREAELSQAISKVKKIIQNQSEVSTPFAPPSLTP